MRMLVRIFVLLFVAMLPVAYGQSLACQFAAGEKPSADRSQATVIIYRASGVVGGLYKPSVFDENGEILKMRNGRFVALTVKPGSHTFTSTMAGNKVTIDAKAGETYYLVFTLATYSQYGTFKGQVTQVEAGQAKTEVAKLKPVDAGDMVRK